MATLTLATWATALQYGNLTGPVVDAAVKSLYNWAGCAIGGFAQSAPAIAQNTTAPFSGPATASILGSNSSTGVDAQVAALVNGIASHIDDYDDTHLETIIHPAGPVASALLAVSEWKGPVSGSDFLTAFVAGVEGECKLGLSVYPQHYNIGWHITSTTGSIGAAVAVGKILNLDVPQMQQAIGIASTQVIGMQEFFGSDTKSFHVGRAAQSGLIAALLAGNGFTSSLESLEAKYGWSHVVSTRENVTDEFATLGKTWEIEKNTFKPFPCGIVIHPTIDGSIQLHTQIVNSGLNISSIKNVTARVNPQVETLTGKRDPQTGLEGKFSVFHAAAVGLLFGKATPTEFTDAVVKDQTVIDLRDKINTTLDDTVNKDEAFITVVFENGTTLEQHVEHAIGSLDNPLSNDQLRTKFMDQASRVIGQDRAEAAFNAFLNIGNLSNVAELAAVVSGNSSSSASAGGNATGGGAGSSSEAGAMGGSQVGKQLLTTMVIIVILAALL